MSRRCLLLSLVLPSAHAWGYCQDDNENCGVWAKDGECKGENNVFMTAKCPLSCEVCNNVCRDVEESCIDWAKDGQCKANPTYMAKSCPTSCGICKEKCYDKEPGDKCGEWAREGECKKNPAIISQCPVSCGACSSMCIDRNSNCPQWAAAGDCSNNTGYMLRECSHSCKVCTDEKGISTCEDRQISQCLIWGEQECNVNPGSMYRTCPRLCGACGLLCADKHESCPGWAAAKEGKACAEEGGWLLSSCPYSCGICAQVNRFPRKEKDEV